MPNWKYQVNFSDFYHNDNISIKEKARCIVSSLRNIKLQSGGLQEELEIIIDNFIDFAESEDKLTVDDFNLLMSELYEFADYNHLIWIKTQ